MKIVYLVLMKYWHWHVRHLVERAGSAGHCIHIPFILPLTTANPPRPRLRSRQVPPGCRKISLVSSSSLAQAIPSWPRWCRDGWVFLSARASALGQRQVKSRSTCEKASEKRMFILSSASTVSQLLELETDFYRFLLLQHRVILGGPYECSPHGDPHYGTCLQNLFSWQNYSRGTPPAVFCSKGAFPLT